MLIIDHRPVILWPLILYVEDRRDRVANRYFFRGSLFDQRIIVTRRELAFSANVGKK